MLKIACVHTGAGAGIFGLIESELKKRIPQPFVVTHTTDPELIARISKNHAIQKQDVTELLRMYLSCVESGANIILNMCSSVGAVADVAQPLFEMANIKLVRIDHQMCMEAVSQFKHIAVVATLSSTLSPSCELLESCADEQNTHIVIHRVLIDGAFGLGRKELAEKIIERISDFGDSIDAIVLAQNSMAESEQLIYESLKIPVFSSPAYAAQEVAEIAGNLSV